MKKVIALSILATAVCLFAAESPTAPSPRETAERNRKLVEKFSASICSVHYLMKPDADGEMPHLTIPYHCPNCGQTHSRPIGENIENDLPYVQPAFVVAPNRVMARSLPIRNVFIDRIIVVIGEKRYPAKPVERYPDACAVLLETEKPMEGVKPIAFDGDPKTAKPTYFFIVDEDGLLVSGNKPVSPNIRHYLNDGGKDVVSGLADTLVVDDRNNAITLSFLESYRVGEDPFTPPASWKRVAPDEQDRQVEALTQRIARSVVPIHLHVDTKEASEPRYRRHFSISSHREGQTISDSGDSDTIGWVMPNGEILLRWTASADALYRLDKIEIALPDKKLPLQFVGALPKHACIVLKPQNGTLPEGIQPLGIYDKPMTSLYLDTLFAASIRNCNGDVRIQLMPERITSFERIRGGIVIPDSDNDIDEQPLVSANGEWITLPGSLWIDYGDEWDMEENAIPAKTVWNALSAKTYHAQYKPREGKDRKQIAWIGVETQSLSPELAREKKALAFLMATKSDGALVNRVYPDSPATKAGVKEGDILLYVRPAASQKRIKLEADDDDDGIDWADFFEARIESADRVGETPWPNLEEGVNKVLTDIGIGEEVVLAWVSDGIKKEANVTLEQIPVHFQTATKVKNKELEMIVADMTFEVRGFFRMDPDISGVVITKVKNGSPASIAGLHPLEIITKVNDTPIKDAKHFQTLVKNTKDLTFTVRRLTATRIVRIQLDEK
ncbi:MAG: PDZ domain-containing protein [Kiritimatiellae bacterium]|nr:PDZ domain-containing protein [Kiritimatiellia bacterium]